MHPEKSTRHHEEGKIHFRNKKFSNAESAFKKAIKFNAGNADAHNDLGNLYLQRGRLKEAYNAYRKALKIVPDHPLLLNNIGNALMMQGELEKALSWLNKAIERNPDSAAVHYNLGCTQRLLGKSSEASDAFRRAIELDPDRTLYHCNLGECLIELEKPENARGCFERALQLNPEDQRACLGLGKAWNAIGNLDQAISAYQKAISIDASNAKSFSGLGRAYEDHGEIDRAVQAAEAALAIDSGLVPAYQILVRNRKLEAGDHEIEKMESLFASKDISEIKKSQLAFCLGKAYEDIGDFDRSMEFVVEGNRLRRSLYDYSIADSLARFEKIKAVFSPQFFSACSGYGASDRTPIFVLGMPRSGTTLVEQILASHAEVFGAGELDDLAKVYLSIGDSGVIPGLDNFPQALVGLDPNTFESLGNAYLERIRKHSRGAKFVTDKTPHNFLRIGFIRAILPNARIINCTRNPIDNCLSLFKTDFQKGQLYSYDMQELGQYYRLYLDLMEYWKTTLPGFIYDQSYEELVGHQQQQTKLLLEHCGLPWDDACLKFHKTKRRIATASNAQVNRPIYQDSVNLWTRYEKNLGPLISSLDK